MTTLPRSAISLCNATIASRTFGTRETSDTASPTSGERSLSVTSAPSTPTRAAWGASGAPGSMAIDTLDGKRATAAWSSRSTLRSSAAQVIARYIMPVSTKR